MSSEPGETSSTAPPVPTCYRHPGRETYIRCARCGRPICPDCMIPASVGFQCPECVREGRATQRQPRAVLGGRVSANSPVTLGLIGLNVVLFVVEMATGGVGGSLGRALWQSGIEVANGEYYRLITAAFLHAGLLHIGFNMYALYLFGPELERVLGWWRFLALYLVCALAGSAASFVFTSPGTASVGASGAIFGLIGAYFVVARRLNRDTSWLLGLLLINALLPLWIPDIDWHAHAGGFAVGLVAGAVLAYAPRTRRAEFQIGGLIVILIAIVVVDVLRVDHLRQPIVVGLGAGLRALGMLS